MEAGGGQTETVTGDSFWNGDWGIRFCVVDVASQTVVSATYDAANKSSGYENYRHFGKTNKFDYRGGASLSFQQSDYSWEDPAVTIPTIVRTSGAPDIKAIKDYFTDETVIRWIGDVTGMAYDTLISGDYKLFIEPILYYTFDSQKYAMTATEAALFDRAINGLLLRTMGNATHQQLPLSLYLEKSDLGFSKWAGAKTGIQNDTNIINYLGMGIVSFIPEEEPEPGTGGNGDGPTVPISFRKTDPERFNAANYNTGLITFAPASSNSAAFDNISGAVIEISGNGTGAGTYELPCTVELGEGTFSAVFNTLPPDIHYEETYINLPVDERAIRDAILPPQDEEGMTEFEKAWRKNQAGFADRFAMQMTRTEIYLTLSYRVRAKLDNALAILLAAGERIQAYLSELGVTMEPVSVKQSLWLLHAIYNPYEEDTFITRTPHGQQPRHLRCWRCSTGIGK